ncbi:unnamed protein product [Phaedon cochleariae]|uniref:Calponin-homology (CH) domain-containing protein n=1 Tax=Phaedon cochleariae TaxID=80249 RepID=A0A9P0DW30_PHACE|nr:unnamed protein product [Phaedon cochleariae]
MEEITDILQGPSSKQGSVYSSRANSLLFEESLKVESKEVENVRITPAKMVFWDAYDGKKFTQSFTIINVGKHPALVRVFSPTSKAFKMKPLPRGRYLASGMSITRKITYTYNSAMALSQACLSIYVNENLVVYDLQVYISKAYITLKPKILNFGEIDVGTASEQMAVQMINKGHKGAQFVVDLSRNVLELIVHPMKGVIQPLETREIRVEILGSEEGTFLKEFWIKTEPPQRVWITGTFISPKLVMQRPITTSPLTVIDFPKTYYGAESTRTLIIENSSSTSTMFCTFAELQGDQLMCLDAAREVDDNLKSFYISPKEGRLMAKYKCAIKINFSPKKLKSFSRSYCMVFIQIVKVNYRDGVIEEKDIEVKTFSSNIDLDQYSIASMQSITKFPTEEIEDPNISLRVCLYGEIEEASVQLIPDALDIDQLVVGQSYMRTFTMKNKSNSTPIAFRYDKVACIEMDPNELCLKPNGSTDISVIIKPSRIGQVENKIGLKLFHQNKQGSKFQVGNAFLCIKYVATIDTSIGRPPMTKPRFNMGITPALTNEVGFLVGDVRFNSEIKKPIQAIVDGKLKCFKKDNDALIAFPNDRSNSLRPWRSQVPCKTIFAGIPRYDDVDDEKYTLSLAEKEFKKFNKKYYEKYLRMKKRYKDTHISSGPDSSDYDITGRHCLMKEKFTLDTCPSLRFQEKIVLQHIPLRPESLTRVQIKPRYIQLGEIAPYTSCSDCFVIKNNNQFSINITIRALSNSVVIKGKRRIIIEPFQTKNIFFDCYSHGLGKYYVPVYIIVNDCHIFDATVFAEVVPTTVKCRFQEVRVCPRSHEAYFKISNPVNCSITYRWDVQDQSYDIVPKSGSIPFRRNINCRVRFTPQKDAVFATEIYLMSQSGAKQIVRVVHDNVKPDISFHTDVLDFGNIPLNTPITKDLIMRNSSEETIMVLVLNPNPLEGITVSPTSITLQGRCEMFFKVSVHFKSVVDFKCALNFELKDEYHHAIDITGHVTYPEIKIEPNFIQIPKIVTGAFRRRVFRVTNKSATKNSIKFFFKFSSEFTITDAETNTPKDNIVLDPEESKDLYLEFRPIEPAAYSIYLPCIINDLLGPPVLNNPSSLDPLKYFEKLDITLSRPIVCPKSLPLVNVRCAAGAPWFTFSSMRLEFNNYDGKNMDHLIIKNISQVSHTIRLSLSKVELPFSIAMHCCQGIFEVSERYFKVNLAQNQDVMFNIGFNPEEYGSFRTEVPILVDQDKCPFNILTLLGNNPMPEILFEPEILYMPTIAVLERIVKVVNLTFLAHKSDCKVEIEVDDENIELVMEEKRYSTDFCSKLDITVVFKPQYQCHVVCKITVTCSCGISCDVEVRTSSCNASLVSYLNNMSLGTRTDFPYFPSEGADGRFLKEMTSLTTSLEMWLHSQGFYYKNYYKIPDTISRFPFEMHKSTPNNNKTFHLPLVQLLVNIMNKSILKFICDTKSKPSPDLIQRTIYVYNVYKNIIHFMESQKVFVQQLCPEFLLPYNKYLILKNVLIDKDAVSTRNVLNEAQFYRMSKQCWIDLLLNIYKTFVFDRTLSIVKPREEEVIYEKAFSEYVDMNKCKFPKHTDENENKLLLWLEFHFNKQKSILWPGQDIKSRSIRCFEKDIKDSMVLATLLVAYCPYILNVLQDSYNDSDMNGDMDVLLFHNACSVSGALRKLNLSFTMKISNIFEPTKIEIIMLLTYLYDVLPYFYPQESIEIKASLGETASNNITLKNCGNVPIAYSNSLFLNESEQFQIDSTLIVIPPMKEKVLKVSYTAKSFLKARAVLVLSGETIGYRFAKSRAINLIGIPDIFFVTEEYNFKVNTFETINKVLHISSPYEQSYMASIYLYVEDENSKTEDEQNFVTSSTLIADNVPRQICIVPECLFDDEGSYAMNLKLCFVTCENYMRYVYFMNKDVGVFCIKISIQASFNKKIFEDISIKVPRNFRATEPCNCKRGVPNNLCSKFFHFEVPYRNPFLLEGLKKMINNSLNPDEYDFWVKNLVHPKGFHLLSKYLSNTFDDRFLPFKNILDTTVTYKATVNRKRYVIDPLILMTDVTIEGGCKIFIHWESEELPKEEMLVLEADHGKEIRQYRLVFVNK